MKKLENNEIKARIPIAILVLAYVVLHFIGTLTIEYTDWRDAVGQIVGSFPLILLGVYLIAMYKKQYAAPYIVFVATTIDLSWSYQTYNGVYILSQLLSGRELNTDCLVKLFASAATILWCIAIFLIVKGSKKSKTLLIISSVLSTLMTILRVVYMSEYNKNHPNWRYEKAEMFVAILPILLYVALILYAALNDPIAGISGTTQPAFQTTAQMTPYQALSMLEDKLDLGLMTEEEYKARRKEIISKL